MPVYRVVLFRMKGDATEEQKLLFIRDAKKLREEIPGVLSLEVGPALDMHRTKGYDMGIVLQLETAAHLEKFASHPGHVRLHYMREAMCEDSLAFNLEY
ncbi:hypothetical protein FE257_001479 [Aspergillus nanangensis]|uniref:Stress-response A/B barrel domain-containing protein n=1 Tax=Aspergillus nanangensis TaxID=2582783 RepID=A0AAD4GNT8_ASPNN|nr:hypothetical protein FE257_001479 [Aspergillus nanangensis]